MSRTFADLLPTSLAAEGLAELAPLSRADDLLLLLTRWVERGWLRALDKAFVAFLHELAPDDDPLVLLAAALTLFGFIHSVDPRGGIYLPWRLEGMRREIALQFAAAYAALAVVLGLLSLQRRRPGCAGRGRSRAPTRG